MRLLDQFADHVEGHVQLDLAAHGLGVLDQFGVRIGTSEHPATAQAGRGWLRRVLRTAGPVTRSRFLVELATDGAQALLARRCLSGAFLLHLILARLVLACLFLTGLFLARLLLARLLLTCLFLAGLLLTCLFLARLLLTCLFLALLVLALLVLARLLQTRLFLPSLFLARFQLFRIQLRLLIRSLALQGCVLLAARSILRFLLCQQRAGILECLLTLGLLVRCQALTLKQSLSLTLNTFDLCQRQPLRGFPGSLVAKRALLIRWVGRGRYCGFIADNWREHRRRGDGGLIADLQLALDIGGRVG